MNKTTSIKLQERQSAPLALNNSAESLNAMSLSKKNSKFNTHFRSGYNTSNGGSMSARVFVLGVDGKPLTPCKSSKARKLLKNKQAKPVWNKFSQFGIQMLVETRKHIPLTVMGQDWGTKFEGYTVICHKENILNVMLKLPNKKKLFRKLKERRMLRNNRRFRKCRRRQYKANNRNKKGFIAPSQLQIVNSRLKCMNELFKCYPIQKVCIEDIRFNHKKYRWGKNFTTMEVGKSMIYNHIQNKIGIDNLYLFNGYDTKAFRDKLGLKKCNNKSKKIFTSHCIDSFVLANHLSSAQPNKKLIYVDDSYRGIKRKMFYTKILKHNKRVRCSSGSNFKGIKKGCMCEYGQIGGGTQNRIYYYDYNLLGKKLHTKKEKTLNKINWLSHHFKTIAIANV